MGAMEAVSAGNSAMGMASDKTILTWWVTSVDAAAGKLSLVDPRGGQIHTFSVTNPDARADLSRVKPGDKLTSINSDIAAVSINLKV
jgi:hypothetical protein